MQFCLVLKHNFSGKCLFVGQYDYNKAFYQYNKDKYVFQLALNKFINNPKINKILLVTDKENIHLVENMYYENNKIQIIEGGIKRIDSVSNALKLVDTKYAIIHDSA
jgi:2-C-methyl-D-erythritol 4-phosphate cytidylyltransferase